MGEPLNPPAVMWGMEAFGLPIHDVFVVPSIPRTSSGKIRRGECEALYREYVKSS